MISNLLVDDQRVIREGLKALLEPELDIRVIGVAGDGHECLEQVEALRPDVALIDIEMPRMDGLSVTKVIATRFNFCKVLILSSYDDAQLVTQALDAGARGYLLKDIKPHLLPAVEQQASEILLKDNDARAYLEQSLEKEAKAKITLNHQLQNDVKQKIKTYDRAVFGINGCLEAMQLSKHLLPNVGESSSVAVQSNAFVDPVDVEFLNSNGGKNAVGV